MATVVHPPKAKRVGRVARWVPSRDPRAVQRRIDRRLRPGIRVATAKEGRDLFDYQARKLLNISGEEFLRRWDAGQYRHVADETAEERAVLRLVMLLPFVRRQTS